MSSLNAGVSGTADWNGWLERQRAEVDAAISVHLNLVKAASSAHSRLAEAVEYSTTQRGKRLRPVLVLEACRACGGSATDAMPAALAVEFVHTFSLIHDDLPAMDNDALRRGQPTNHVVFGDANAILAGDWLLAHAFSVLAGAPRGATLCAELAAGAEAMIAGQAADIAGEQQSARAELVRYIHVHKTARLFETCCRLGALSAEAEPAQVEALGAFGQRLGLAFQIVDDLLDCTGDAARVGKTVQKDGRARKQTYPGAFGIEESRRQARREADAAVAALSGFGADGDWLRGLTRFVIEREK